MAGALELILCCQPAWSASEVGALREQGIETFLLPHDPDTKFLFEFFIDLS
jgi:hypothetical protein